MEEEHEVYGGDIPEEVEGDIDTGLDEEPDDLLLKDDPTTDEAASKVNNHYSNCFAEICVSTRVFSHGEDCEWRRRFFDEDLVALFVTS